MSQLFPKFSIATTAVLLAIGAAHAQDKRHANGLNTGDQFSGNIAPTMPEGTPGKHQGGVPAFEYPLGAREYAAFMMNRVIEHATNEPFNLQSNVQPVTVGTCECFWDNGGFDNWNGQGSAEGAAFNARCADDFYLPECSIYRLDQVSAVMLVDSSTPPAAFLEIYADCNGAPTGDPLGTFDMITATHIGNFIGGLQVWEFSFDTSACNLRGGCTYWASPVGIGNGTSEDVYYFATTTAPAGGVQINQGHFTKPEGFVTFPDWTPVEVTNVKKRDFAFAVCVTECDQLWDNGQADLSRAVNKAVSANLPNFRAADNFALAPCVDWNICMVELCILTSCECATVSMEIYETDPITMLPTGSPIITATDPKVFDLNFSMADNTGVVVRAKRLQFGADLELNETLEGGKTYWVSIVEGGTLSGTDRLYFCYSYKCEKPDDCQVAITEAAFYKPVLGEWRPYSLFVNNAGNPNELAFAVFGHTTDEVPELSTPTPTPDRIYSGDRPIQRRTADDLRTPTLTSSGR